ncbi:MAG: hypothetical protein R3C12_02130 [Planctomycetaceae bacterium]
MNQQSTSGIGTFSFNPGGKTLPLFKDRQLDVLHGFAQHEPPGLENEGLPLANLEAIGHQTEKLGKSTPGKIDIQG